MQRKHTLKRSHEFASKSTQLRETSAIIKKSIVFSYKPVGHVSQKWAPPASHVQSFILVFLPIFGLTRVPFLECQVIWHCYFWNCVAKNGTLDRSSADWNGRYLELQPLPLKMAGPHGFMKTWKVTFIKKLSLSHLLSEFLLSFSSSECIKPSYVRFPQCLY